MNGGGEGHLDITMARTHLHNPSAADEAFAIS